MNSSNTTLIANEPVCHILEKGTPTAPFERWMIPPEQVPSSSTLEGVLGLYCQPYGLHHSIVFDDHPDLYIEEHVATGTAMTRLIL